MFAFASEADALQEPRCFPLTFHNQTAALGFRHDVLELANHDPADALSPQFGRYHNVGNLHGISGVLHRQNGDEVPGQLAEQSACRDGLLAAVALEEATDLVVIFRLDCANKQALATHEAY